MIRQKHIKMVAVLGSIALATGVLGNACSKFETGGSGNSALNSSGLCTSSADFKVIAGAQTEAIVYGDQVLQNMMACTSLVQSSPETLAEHEARKASFSRFGYVGDVNSAMMMGIAALAVEVCADLIDQESPLPPNSRRIFNAIDFAQMPSASAIDDTANRIARSCWGRMPSSEELTIVKEEVNAMGNANAGFKAIGVCASVLASLDGIRQ